MQREGCTFDDVTYQVIVKREWAQFTSYETTERYKEAIDSLHHLCNNIEPGTNARHWGSVSPTVVNFNRRFSPHFNLQLAYIRFTNAS